MADYVTLTDEDISNIHAITGTDEPIVSDLTEEWAIAETDYINTGDYVNPHAEHEDIVTHGDYQIRRSEVETSVTTKLTNLIRGYYHSPEGVYPITEFYYLIGEHYITIYDRYGVYMMDVGIGSFTAEEVEWIANNLPLYITGEELQDVSKIHLDFTEMRKDGWMVWRRSGTLNNLIGYIRKNLEHHVVVEGQDYYFDERSDLTMVSEYELAIINAFIASKKPTVEVTDVVIDYTDIHLSIGESQPITITVYPFNAENKEVEVSVEDESVAIYKNNRVKAINEGITQLRATSVANPEAFAVSNIEVIEFSELLNNRYNIVRTPDYDYDRPYIIGMDEGTIISDFISSFRNRSSDIYVYYADGTMVSVLNYYELIRTGMIIKLVANGRELDELVIVVRGDIDGNGVVNGYDKQCIRNHVNGATILEGCYFIAADVDFNHTVNLDDLNKIDRYLRGEIPSLNV